MLSISVALDQEGGGRSARPSASGQSYHLRYGKTVLPPFYCTRLVNLSENVEHERRVRFTETVTGGLARIPPLRYLPDKSDSASSSVLPSTATLPSGGIDAVPSGPDNFSRQLCGTIDRNIKNITRSDFVGRN